MPLWDSVARGISLPAPNAAKRVEGDGAGVVHLDQKMMTSGKPRCSGIWEEEVHEIPHGDR